LITMARTATIGELIAHMEDIQARLDASGDARRYWHGVYRRGTVAIRSEIERGGFHDPAWLERWDLVFADFYLEAMERWDRGRAPSGPWQVAFEAARDDAAAARPGDRSLADRLLAPANRAASKKFLREARAKVYGNARLLCAARRRGPEPLAGRIAQLEDLCRARVADLRAPGQVLLKLALRGFGVVLPGPGVDDGAAGRTACRCR
jgi:hypothetical protein